MEISADLFISLTSGLRYLTLPYLTLPYSTLLYSTGGGGAVLDNK